MKNGDVYRVDRRFPRRDDEPRPGDIARYTVVKVRTKDVTFEVRENDGRGPKKTVTLARRVADWVASRHLGG